MAQEMAHSKRKQLHLHKGSPWKTLQSRAAQVPGLKTSAVVCKHSREVSDHLQKLEIAEHYTRNASLELCCWKKLCREGKVSVLQQHCFKRGREKERICITKDITRKDKWDKPKSSLNHVGSVTISQAWSASWENSTSRGTAEHPDHSPGILTEKPVHAQLWCLCHPQTITKMLLGQHVGHRQQMTAVSISGTA